MPADFRKRRGGFTMEEIVVVVFVVALLAVVAFAFARYHQLHKRTAAQMILDDLRMLDAATDQYAIGNAAKAGTMQYLTGAELFGDTYGPFTVDSISAVPVRQWSGLSDVPGNAEAFGAAGGLPDVLDSTYWSPYSTGH